MNRVLAVGIGLIVLAMLFLWAALTLALVAEHAGTDSLTAKVVALWVMPFLVAGVALVFWEKAPR